MKKIYFTSDIHIDSNSPKIKEKFLKFLSNNANNMSELYILGDLFEYWIDDKKNIQEKVKELRVWYTGATRSKNTLHLLGTYHQYHFPLGKYYNLYLANYGKIYR